MSASNTSNTSTAPKKTFKRTGKKALNVVETDSGSATTTPMFPSDEWFKYIADVPLKDIKEECEKKLKKYVEENGIEAFRQIEIKSGSRFCGSGNGLRKVKGVVVGQEGHNDKLDDQHSFLTMEELEISKYAEKKLIVDENIKRKGTGKGYLKTEKASFTCEVSFDKSAFDELVAQIKAPNGKDYTASAFQHAINYYLHSTLHIGWLASVSRTLGGKRYNKEKNSCGLNIDEGYLRSDNFMNGFFDTEEAHEQMSAYISKQKVAEKKPKKSLEDQLADMTEEEMMAMIMKAKAKKKAKQEAEASAQSSAVEDSDEASSVEENDSDSN